MKYRDPLDVQIDSLSADGFGLSTDGGYAVYGGLPGEKVRAVPLVRKHRKLFLQAIEVENISPDRVEPICEAAAICGGCSFQHMEHSAQLEFKVGLLKQHLLPLEPVEWLPPLTGPQMGYRSKARLGVRYVEKKGRVLVGFREKQKPYITDISRCPVLSGKNAELIAPLQELVGSLSIARSVPQIEVASGDTETALIFRHLEPCDKNDLEVLENFGDVHGLQIYLQPGGMKTIHRIYPDEQNAYLKYSLPELALEFNFRPSDFTQVNLAVNRQMVTRAVDLLDLKQGDGVLDAFCGIGNFSLALASSVERVVGTELIAESIDRARLNAQVNDVENVTFEVIDMHAEPPEIPGFTGLNKVLLDPPRSGAKALMKILESPDIERVVYVSCNPETLARDAKMLVQQGYFLRSAGIIDMFPHTTHVESVALFCRQG